jgi:5-formyltetrahydrofolate cyclo-ligase
MRGGHDVREQKERLRRRSLARRGKLRLGELRAASVALRDVLLSVPEVSRAAVVAAYIGVGTEPGTGPLLEALGRRGVRVLLPVLSKDFDLDWAEYDGTNALASGPMGLLEPTGPRLGVTAVARADTVLLPGLAADRSGMRLGRGGGSYDRALTRIAAEAFSCVLLHDGEISDGKLPAELHDLRVRAAATPSGLLRFDQP